MRAADRHPSRARCRGLALHRQPLDHPWKASGDADRGAEHDDGQVGPLTLQPRNQPQPIESPHVEIGQDQIRRISLDGLERTSPSGSERTV